MHSPKAGMWELFGAVQGGLSVTFKNGENSNQLMWSYSANYLKSSAGNEPPIYIYINQPYRQQRHTIRGHVLKTTDCPVATRR